MSWLEDNLLGAGMIVGGGIATAYGGGAFGVPMMAGGASMMNQNATNAKNIKEQDKANSLAQVEAQKNRDFNEQMSNTEMQRKAADLKAAGLNPMLAGLNQQGASASSSASPSQGAATAKASAAEGFSTAIGIRQAKTAMDAQGSQSTLNTALGAKALASAGADSASARQTITQTKALKSQLEAITSKAKLEKAQSDADASAVDYDFYMNRVSREAGTAGKVIGIGNSAREFRHGNLRYDNDKMKNESLGTRKKNTILIDRKTGEIYRD